MQLDAGFTWADAAGRAWSRAELVWTCVDVGLDCGTHNLDTRAWVE